MSKPKKDEGPKVKVVLTTMGQEYRGEGDSILVAIESIPLEWNRIKAKGEMVITEDGKTVTKLFYLKQLRMLFANRMRRIGFVRQLEDLMLAQ